MYLTYRPDEEAKGSGPGRSQSEVATSLGGDRKTIKKYSLVEAAPLVGAAGTVVRAETLVAAARLGVAVTRPLGQGRAPNAVRLAVSSPPPSVLATTLDTLGKLAGTSPEETTVD